MSKILVVGDIMLDEYVDGEIHRISPEAPIPVFVETGRRYNLGGAGNVAAGIAALGCDTTLIGNIGNGDDGADIIFRLLTLTKINDRTRHYGMTTKKTRYVVKNRQMFRVDREQTTVNESVITQNLDHIRVSNEVTHGRYDIIVISDYAKGFISKEVSRRILASKCKVIVDPKNSDWSRYAGAYLITPNRKEFEETFRDDHCDTRMKDEYPHLQHEWLAKLMEKLSIKNCLITDGANGMMLYDDQGGETHFPATNGDAVDVTGAGDTVVAMIAASLSNGVNLRRAVELASFAAGIAVSRYGTHVVTKEEIGGINVYD